MVSSEIRGPRAHRELIRQEIAAFEPRLDWLRPDAIPESALDYTIAGKYDSGPYLNLSMWLVDKFAAAAREVCPHLDYVGTFDKHQLNGREREFLRHLQHAGAQQAYYPGMIAMGEIFEAIPHVAAREGRSPDDWKAIASQARNFGQQIAVDGTALQVFVRAYLGSTDTSENRLHPELLKLDDELGVTTVTPLDDLKEAALSSIERFGPQPPRYPGSCVALQVPLPSFEGANLFDVVWDSYGEVVSRLIHPTVEVESCVQNDPDPFAAITMDALTIQQYDPEYKSQMAYGNYSAYPRYEQ